MIQVLPSSERLRDFRMRLEELMASLSVMEDRPAAEIVTDVLAAGASERKGVSGGQNGAPSPPLEGQAPEARGSGQTSESAEESKAEEEEKTPIISAPEVNGEATRAAAEGQAALASGDTRLARSRFADAGRALEAKVASSRKQPDKHLARFLAASQYFQGGHYPKALELARRIEAKFLPTEVRPLFEKFFRDANERSDAAYEERTRKALLRHWESKDFEAVLRMFQDHPYVLPPAKMAFLRAICCERLKDYHAAAVFFADALKGTPEGPELVFTSAACPLTLAKSGNLSEAWSYVEHQLRELPHAVPFMTASLLRFHQATKATSEEDRRSLFGEQLRLFAEASKRYQQLPEKVRDNPKNKEFMVLCFEAAALVADRSGDAAGARQIGDAAVRFAPQSYAPRTVRGIITYPSEQAIEDFREAIRLGEKNYYPFYYLAHVCLVAGDYQGAISWSRQALEHRPSRTIEAQLYAWLAVARARLGAPGEEVLALLRQAQQLDPDHPEIRHNARMLESSMATAMTTLAHQLVHAQIAREWEEHVAQEESEFMERRSRTDPAQRELALAEV